MTLKDKKVELHNEKLYPYSQRDYYYPEEAVAKSIEDLKAEFEAYSTTPEQFLIDCEIIDRVFGFFKSSMEEKNGP